MKKTIVIAAMLLLSLTGFAQTAKSIYNKFSEAENVSTVYISPAMFKLMGSIPAFELGDEDVNLTPIINSLEGMYIISSENQAVNREMRKEIEKFVSKGEYELLMEAKDEGDRVRMFTRTTADIVKSFVMLAVSDEECTFIMFDGSIDQQKFGELVSSLDIQ